MTTVASLVFCNACGNLLAARTTARRRTVKCEICKEVNSDKSSNITITRSKPSDYPSALRKKLGKMQNITEDDVKQDPIIDHECEKCGHGKVRFRTQQTRSADEGSTVFYDCVKCNYSWSLNN